MLWLIIGAFLLDIKLDIISFVMLLRKMLTKYLKLLRNDHIIDIII